MKKLLFLVLITALLYGCGGGGGGGDSAPSHVPTIMAVVDVLHMSVSGVKGMTSGTITIYVKVSTAKRGTFIFNINVRDEANQHSNPLTGTFLVY